MSESAIRVRGLRKVYRSGFLRRRFTGLEGLDLEVKRGEIFGYIGPNGAGKTTTIKLLMGLNFPTAGEAELLGRPLGDLEVKRRIGFLPERPYFYDYLTASEFLHFYGQLHGIDRKTREARIEELLPLVHMERARDVPLRKFSKGMLQRVGVAQALINEPELVVMDEPMSGLDPMGRMMIRDIILGLRDKGTTVLFSSHILSDVESICDRVGIIAGGVLQYCGRVSDYTDRAKRSVEVTVEGEGARALSEAPPLLTQGGRLTYAVPDEEAADALVRAAVQRGLRVLSVIPRRADLEQLFVDEVTALERIEREKSVR